MKLKNIEKSLDVSICHTQLPWRPIKHYETRHRFEGRETEISKIFEVLVKTRLNSRKRENGGEGVPPPNLIEKKGEERYRHENSFTPLMPSVAYLPPNREGCVCSDSLRLMLAFFDLMIFLLAFFSCYAWCDAVLVTGKRKFTICVWNATVTDHLSNVWIYHLCVDRAW